jgi:hypothetical protein
VTALDAAVATVNAEETTDNALVCAKVRALLHGYAARWLEGDKQVSVLAVEVTSRAPVTNPGTGRGSRKFSAAGVLDVLIERHGRRCLLDHKTTSEDVEDPASTYWRQLIVEAQPSHYMLLEWLNGRKIDEAVWDVVKKPSISPRQFKSKAEKALAVSARKWFDHNLGDDTLAYLQTEDRENMEMYEARLTHDCTTERPDRYFQRRSVPRLDQDIMAYAKELWEAGQILLDARNKDRWPKHPRSCMAHGRPCEYLGICSGFDTLESNRWRVVEQVHREIPDLEGSGIDVLTFSSITTYQQCPRKYFYRYERGIERTDEEEAEALYFGTIFHLGLAAYWQALMPEEKPNGYRNETGTEFVADGPEGIVG